MRPWTKRVELPTFEGNDLLGWITRAALEDCPAALNRRFGGRERSTIFESLTAIRQDEKVDDYIQEFEILSQAPHTFEEQLLEYFFAERLSEVA